MDPYSNIPGTDSPYVYPGSPASKLMELWKTIHDKPSLTPYRAPNTPERWQAQAPSQVVNQMIAQRQPFKDPRCKDDSWSLDHPKECGLTG